MSVSLKLSASGDTAAAGDIDATAVVADSPRTVAAERYSEAPTTIVPDVGPTRAAELAWSSEAEAEEIADRSHGWRGRILWLPLVAFPRSFRGHFRLARREVRR
jgi:hypothetical protein